MTVSCHRLQPVLSPGRLAATHAMHAGHSWSATTGCDTKLAGVRQTSADHDHHRRGASTHAGQRMLLHELAAAALCCSILTETTLMFASTG